MTRILVADDHEVIRTGLKSIIETRSEWKVVAEASDGNEAIFKADETRPDVAILDYSMPLKNGIEAASHIRTSNPKTEVLIFTVHESESVVGEALEAGARGFLFKSDAQECLIFAIEALSANLPFFSAQVSQRLLDTYLQTNKRKPRDALSPRERVVMQLAAEGRTNRDMCSILNVSIKTIEARRATAMLKLKFTSTAEVVRYAVRNKWFEP